VEVMDAQELAHPVAQLHMKQILVLLQESANQVAPQDMEIVMELEQTDVKQH
jgi:hypothetical protein